MKLTVPSTVLAKEVALVANATVANVNMPALGMMRLEAADGALSIAGADLEIALRSEVAAEVATPGVAIVDAKRLTSYVRQLAPGDVAISTASNHWATFSCGGSRARIAGVADDDYPRLPSAPPPQLRVPHRLMSLMLRGTLYAISTDAPDGRFCSRAAMLKVGGGKMRMAALDGHRLALYEMPHEGGEITELLPLRAMQEALRLADLADDGADVEFSRTANRCFFTAGPRSLSTAMIAASFPDVDTYLPPPAPTTRLIPKREFHDALRRVASFSEKTRVAWLDFHDEGLTLSSPNSMIGDCREHVPAIGNSSRKVALNNDYIRDFLEAIEQEHVRMALPEKWQMPVVLQPEPMPEGHNYRCYISPCHQPELESATTQEAE